MRPADIAQRRLRAQGIAEPNAPTPADVVRRLGAIQAQDHSGALWSIALRMTDATRADVEHAIERRTIVRTWPMRGTLHFVPAEDARWMLALLTPRVIASAAGRHRQLELNAETFRHARRLITRALAREPVMTRGALYDVLEAGGIAPAGQRGIHILQRLAMEAVVCFGPHAAAQPTFALFDEWITRSRSVDDDEGLELLARRYFTSHGPATVRDLAGWLGVTLGDARRAVELVRAELEDASSASGETLYWSPQSEGSRADRAQLLPGFDEYLLGYKDRSAVLAPEHAPIVCPGGNGMFASTLVFDGRVRGVWKRRARAGSVVIRAAPFAPLPAVAQRAFALAAVGYGRYLDTTVTLEWPE